MSIGSSGVRSSTTVDLTDPFRRFIAGRSRNALNLIVHVAEREARLDEIVRNVPDRTIGGCRDDPRFLSRLLCHRARPVVST